MDNVAKDCNHLYAHTQSDPKRFTDNNQLSLQFITIHLCRQTLASQEYQDILYVKYAFQIELTFRLIYT